MESSCKILEREKKGKKLEPRDKTLEPSTANDPENIFNEIAKLLEN